MDDHSSPRDVTGMMVALPFSPKVGGDPRRYDTSTQQRRTDTPAVSTIWLWDKLWDKP